MRTNDAKEAFNLLIWQVRQFIRDIVKECCGNPEVYSTRIEVSDSMVKVLIYNSETDEIVGQVYELSKFLNLCKEKKIEFQLNTDVRKLVLKSQDKSNRRLRWV